MQRRILRVLAVTVFLLAIGVGSLLILEEIRDRRERLTIELLSKVEQVEQGLMGFFDPLNACLEILGKWGESGIIDPTGLDQLSGQVGPLLDLLPQVSSVEFSSSGGPSYLVTRTTNGWRSSRLNPDASDLFEFLGEDSAPESSAEPEIDWHFPVTLRQEKTIGAIATVSYVEEGRPWTVGLNIPFSEILALAEALPTDDSEEIVWLTDQGEVVRLRDLSARAAGASQAQLLTWNKGTVADVMTEFLLDEDADSGDVQHFQFNHEGNTWWCAIYPAGIAGQFIRIGLAVPESRLLGAVQRERNILGLVAGGLVTAGILLILVLRLSAGKADDQLTPGREIHGSPARWLEELIEKGETLQVEFKSSMRWNIQKDRPGKEVEFSWLKTLVAFLNTEGGTLIIGVDDNKTVLGLEIDQFPNEDKYLLHFNNRIKEHIGLEFTSLISFEVMPFQGRQVLVVQCRRSEHPVFLKKGDTEEFYVRVGPGSRKLNTRQVLEYLKAR